MDAYNLNETVSVNVTRTIELVAEVAAKVSGTPVLPATIVSDFKDDVKVLTNLTRLIEMTPIVGFTEKVPWD